MDCFDDCDLFSKIDNALNFRQGAAQKRNKWIMIVKKFIIE